MRQYLSFGGGVNSVAMLLMLHEQKQDFEAVFVNHGTDWPETYEYLEMLQGWLKKRGLPQITELRPKVKTIEGKVFDNLYDYCFFKRVFPFRQNRACTDRFKVVALEKYQIPPAWVYIGYAFDEAHRASIQSKKGLEYRWPLIEHEITRDGCIEIIKKHGLPVPMKSGCFICPFQSKAQWKELRSKHPDLFCKARQLENNYIEKRASEGKPPLYISSAPLDMVINESQLILWEADEYPPCNCML